MVLLENNAGPWTALPLASVVGFIIWYLSRIIRILRTGVPGPILCKCTGWILAYQEFKGKPDRPVEQTWTPHHQIEVR